MDHDDRPRHLSTSAIAFDIGLLVSAVPFLLPGVGNPLELLSLSGIVVIAVLVGTALPYSLMRLNAQVVEPPDRPTYRRRLSFAVRLVGMVLVLGTCFVLPYNLKRHGIIPDGSDSLFFVLELLSILAGVLAGYGSLAAGLVIASGAAFLGVAFSLPGDVSAWLGGDGPGPLIGGLGAVLGIGLFVAVGRQFRDLDALSARIERALERPAVARAAATIGPFVLALALAFWNHSYGELAVVGWRGVGGTLMLVLLGVLPYRLLLLLVPPVRLVPTLTGVLALAVWLGGLVG